MKKSILVLTSFAAMIALASCSGNAAKVEPAIPADPAIEAAVEAKLAEMTLEEKVGQMTEVAIDILGHWENGEFVLDQDKLDNAIGKYKVGSVLNTPVVGQTPEKWQEIIGKIQEVSMNELGIPCVYGLDQNHGASYVMGATYLPQNINVGATFNPQVAYDAGVITAYESRAANCPWTYSPTVDLSRDPRWPRVWENYGEDPLVNAIQGSAAVRGMQGEDPNHIGPNNIAVSVKHYLGYGNARTGKDRTPAYIPEYELKEKNFAPFKACIEAGALTIMVNSASVNGIPVHANKELLTGWLKEGLNWDGMIVTDWADINNLYTREGVAVDKKHAIELAINAGIDMTMEPYDLNFCTLLIELVKEGKVSMERIDDAARRVLRLKYRLGLFENPNTPLENYPEFGSEEFAQIATRAAEESEILLKNINGILPLAKGQKILVTGPNANSMRCLNGGWSYTWQGHLADLYTEQYNTIYEAMCNKFGASNVILEQGVTYAPQGSYDEENAPQIEKAVAAARKVDVIVACIGENSYCETPGNIDDLTLSANQRELVKALAATGKPIVLVLNEGRPRVIADIEPLAGAVVQTFLPGNYGGEALARLVAGEANFSGRLPYTYPRYTGALVTYDYKPCESRGQMAGSYNYDAVMDVQYAFGYGLSYTTYQYSNLRADKMEFTAADSITFSIDVTNTGSMAGKESVLLFVSDLVATISPDNKRLRDFEKVTLAPGETRTVKLAIAARDLAFVGMGNRWTLEEGDFHVAVGRESLRIRCLETKVY